MATLTWQDVAGQVRAPDYTDAANLFNKGFEGLVTGVQDVLGGPEQRRQAQLAKEMLSLQSKSAMHDSIANSLGVLSTDIKNNQKEKDIKQFGAAWSTLEAGFRDAAIQGKSFDEYLKTSKEYNSLSDGAKAYGAQHLSDAYGQGMQLRHQAQRDAVNDAQWRQSFALQAENARLARIDRQEAAADRRAAREAANADKPKVWKTGNDKTDKAMTQLATLTGMQFIEASGARYADVTLGDVGKGYKNLGAVSDIFGALNNQRIRSGKQPLPQTVLMKVVDTNIGANSFINGMNDVDDAAITQYLATAADQYDTAMKGREYYERLAAHVDAGSRPEQKDIDLGWNRLFPATQKPVAIRPAKHDTPTSMDAYLVGRK